MGTRTLLIASAGGHLKQLKSLADRLPWGSTSNIWITIDSPQSRTLLEHEEDVIFLPSGRSRDALAALANANCVRRRVRSSEFDYALSTGASIAVSVLPLAHASGASCHYIESAARVESPSLSGRLLGTVPGINRYCQYSRWARRGWSYAGSVFDAFRSAPSVAPRRLRRVVVTLGTLDTYPFSALVERLITVLPPDVEVLWQTGCTPVRDRTVHTHVAVPALDLASAMAEADVVVAHAGVGSALSSLEAGKIPILVPRRAHRREHIDDHQVQLARELNDRGLAKWVEVEELTLDHLIDASTARLERSADKQPPLCLRL